MEHFWYQFVQCDQYLFINSSRKPIINPKKLWLFELCQRYIYLLNQCFNESLCFLSIICRMASLCLFKRLHTSTLFEATLQLFLNTQIHGLSYNVLKTIVTKHKSGHILRKSVKYLRSQYWNSFIYYHVSLRIIFNI